jgi:hypothetical protein
VQREERSINKLTIKLMKKSILTLILSLTAICSWADDSGTCGENLTWIYVEATGTLTISGTGEMADDSHSPWELKNYRSSIIKVVIESGVTTIGKNAFSILTGMKEITIPNSVTDIRGGAFMGCSGLTSIKIPSSVTSIGSSAFDGCTGLKKVIVTDFVAWCKISFRDFYSNPLYYAHHLYSDENNEITELAIPNSVTSIGQSAFAGCTGLTSIDIPNGVATIGESAFSGCTGLTSITIPNSVTYLSGFSGCTGLNEITIPNNVATIGEYAFSGCTGLKEITIPNGVTAIEGHAFSGCENLKTVTVGSGVKSIGSCAFNNCYRLSQIYLLPTEPPILYYNTSIHLTFQLGRYDDSHEKEIYQYAYVHIPKGTHEAYSSAYEWRYFERFKEDLSINGTPYYVKLNVADSNNGYVEQYVKVDESYTVKFWKKSKAAIKRVKFNGEDVTESVKDNTYTTPKLIEDSNITIEYDESNSDINGDGVVDTQDVLEIYKYIQEH